MEYRFYALCLSMFLIVIVLSSATTSSCVHSLCFFCGVVHVWFVMFRDFTEFFFQKWNGSTLNIWHCFFLSFLLQKQMTPNEVRWQMTPNEVRWKSDFVENSLNIRWALTDHKPPSDAPSAFYRDFSAKGALDFPLGGSSQLGFHPHWNTPWSLAIWKGSHNPILKGLIY